MDISDERLLRRENRHDWRRGLAQMLETSRARRISISVELDIEKVPSA